MVVTDNFSTGTDQDLASRSGWTNFYGANVLSAFSASNSLGFNNSAGADCVYYYSGASFADDQYVQVVVGALPSGATTCRPNIIVRRTAGDWLYCEFRNVDNTGAAAAFIASATEGNLSNVDVALTVGDTLRLEVSGTSVSLKQNGTTVLTATTGGPTSGAPGLGGFNSTASNGLRWDDFEAGDLTTTITFFGGFGGSCGGILTA